MQSIRAGTVIAGFRVQSLIGEGAMGTVYLAEDTSTGRRVALKLLSSELAHDERFRRRFLRETELAASLDHPHVVPTLASGEEDGTLYLAMAYVEGSDLRRLLRREGRLEPQRALELVGQVAAALDAAHAAGLVHRDVKPGNVIVEQADEGEHAYVCDFGLARHVSSVSSLTSERGFVGTIDYVPPEQIEGGTIDGRADVYSLGCVLFECLAGERPFDRESELAVLFAHLNDPPPRLTDVRPDMPTAFDAVFERALAKERDDRYSSCGELAEAAREAQRGRVLLPRRRRRRALAAAAIVVAAGALAATLLAETGTAKHHPSPLPLRPNALNLVDARSRQVARAVPYGTRLRSIPAVDVVFTKHAAWLLLIEKHRLEQVDLATHQLLRAVKLPWLPAGRLATGAGMVWVTRDQGKAVWGIDARTGKVERRFSMPGPSGAGIAFGDGSLWLAEPPGIVRVDPVDGRVIARVPTAGQPGQQRWLIFADGALWTVRASNGHVLKIDPATNNKVANATLHGWASDLTVAGGYVWVSIMPDGIAFKLTEDNLGNLGTTAIGRDPERMSAGDGFLWIANTAAGTVSRVGISSGRRTAFAASAEPTEVAYHDGRVWTGAAPPPNPLGKVAGEEIDISSPTSIVDTDPAHAGVVWSEQFWYATCARLLDYPDSAGAAGMQLRPEIAAAMPKVSNGGRTYTFRIRRGFRFSPPSGAPVTAEVFRHTIERTLAPSQEHAWPIGDQILGAAAYSAGNARHISGIAVHGDTLSITLVRPDGDFLTRLAMPSFCPVPLDERVNPNGPTIPSAGPYYVASTSAQRTVLLRNPNYGGDRPRRPAEIVYRSFTPTPLAVSQTDAGAIDYLPPDQDNYSLLTPAGILDQRFGPRSSAARSGNQRYFPETIPFVDGLVFNTRRPLFRSLRLRQAVNYALDRPALATAFYDTPNDQILPISVPGRAAHPFYPLRGPDLATARRLAGNRHRHVVLSACGEPRVAAIVRSDLRRIGMAVSVDCLQRDASYQHADLLLNLLGLGPADRDPEAFLDMAIGGPLNYLRPGPGPWSSPSFRARLQRARALRGTARVAAYTRLQAQLMREAPLAVFGTYAEPEYFSPRVGCKVFQGEYHVVDLGLLCKH